MFTDSGVGYISDTVSGHTRYSVALNFYLQARDAESVVRTARLILLQSDGYRTI